MARTPKERQDEIILELLCCVMVVDRTASALEKAHIHTILSGDGSTWTTAEVNECIMKFIARVEVHGFWCTLDDACDEAAALPMSRVEKLVHDCIALAKSDSEFHDRERKAIGRIQTKLPQLQLAEIATYQLAPSSTSGENTVNNGSEQPRGRQSLSFSSRSKHPAISAKLSGDLKNTRWLPDLENNVWIVPFGLLLVLMAPTVYTVYCEAVYFLLGQSATGTVSDTKFDLGNRSRARIVDPQGGGSALKVVEYTFNESNGTARQDSFTTGHTRIVKGTAVKVEYVLGAPGWSRTTTEPRRWYKKFAYFQSFVLFGFVILIIWGRVGARAHLSRLDE